MKSFLPYPVDQRSEMGVGVKELLAWFRPQFCDKRAAQQCLSVVLQAGDNLFNQVRCGKAILNPSLLREGWPCDVRLWETRDGSARTIPVSKNGK